MTVVYRDKRGNEYVSVPLPTHEVTHAVPIEARRVSRRADRKTVRPFYDGLDGAELFTQPRAHRRRWSDAQWGAFQEYWRLVEHESHEPAFVASAVVIKGS